MMMVGASHPTIPPARFLMHSKMNHKTFSRNSLKSFLIKGFMKRVLGLYKEIKRGKVSIQSQAFASLRDSVMFEIFPAGFDKYILMKAWNTIH